MRKSGRHLKYDKEVLQNAVEEYATSDKTAEEVATKYNMTSSVVLYHYHKMLEQETNNGNKKRQARTH